MDNPTEKRGRGRPRKLKKPTPEQNETTIPPPPTSPSVDDTESEETTLSTQSATDCYVENNNDSNGSYGADNITYGNNVTKNNGPITGSHKDNDTDELPNTIRGNNTIFETQGLYY
ncbi:unnamed protein product [Absidia cylindrospora]